MDYWYSHEISQQTKAVVDGLAGQAMAGPLFLPEMVLAWPRLWPNMFLQGHFLTFPSRPLLMTDFAMIKG